MLRFQIIVFLFVLVFFVLVVLADGCLAVPRPWCCSCSDTVGSAGPFFRSGLDPVLDQTAASDSPPSATLAHGQLRERKSLLSHYTSCASSAFFFSPSLFFFFSSSSFFLFWPWAIAIWSALPVAGRGELPWLRLASSTRYLTSCVVEPKMC